VEWKMADYRGFIGSAEFYMPNAPNGVLLDVFSKTAGPIRVTVTDQAGKQVKRFNARAEAGAITRIAWDLRYDAVVMPEPGGGRGGGRGGAGGGAGAGGGRAGAPQAEGGEEGGGELQNEVGVAPPEGAPPAAAGGGGGRGGLAPGQGTLAEPGTYKVTIAMGDKTASQTVTVEQDPRIQVNPNDREKRRQTIDTLVTLAREADTSRKKAVAIHNSLVSLTASWKLPNAPAVPDAVKKSADELLAKSKTLADRFEAQGGGRGGGGAGPPATYTPPPVTQKIGRLLGALDGYTGAPTSAQMAETQEAAAQLQKDVAELNKVASEVPKLNKMLSDAGVQYINAGS
jgi:hypothetical protein